MGVVVKKYNDNDDDLNTELAHEEEFVDTYILDWDAIYEYYKNMTLATIEAFDGNVEESTEYVNDAIISIENLSMTPMVRLLLRYSNDFIRTVHERST